MARLISLVESASPQLRELSALVVGRTGRAHVVGLTGPPGVGKSTSTSALVTRWRERGLRVGVLAVDPTSPFSGGALLGDRIRLGDHATDPDVFVRSMATRGHLGGVSWATPQALRVLDCAGCDVVVVETVGVGQSEIDVAGLADTVVVLLAPGAGDGVQAAKAGVLEIGDVYVVNKADRDGAARVRRELRTMLTMSERAASGWKPPIVLTEAVRGEGAADLADRIAEHHAWARDSGELRRRRSARVRDEIEALALEQLRRRFGGVRGHHRLDELTAGVVDGRTDPFSAADELVAASSADG